MIDENGLLVGAVVDDTDTLEFINDLTTSVLISLFTDATAGDDDVIPDGTSLRRGWWADTTLGSKLWLLERSKALPSVARQVEQYALDALGWLLTDQIAIEVNAAAVWLSSTMLVLTITITRGSARPISIRFANLWDFL
ncbi:MAG: hypothetical protein ABT10_03025 [Novosphingobium sp. SCN 63-17]|nr:MAG: hypothetical protein ABT10_03025 [Novosphingobium sp. SCN 63-17]OJX93148.1 MAG: hypothetical protein BGP00_23625 [Novosphingobium sp. 63-713]